MRSLLLKLRLLYGRQFLAVLAVALILCATFGSAAFPPSKAGAAAATTINFQARLMGIAGSVASDGNYNIEFKIYDDATAGGTAQGVCTGNCKWIETRTGADVVTVANGYVSVNLGSVIPGSLPGSINWDQDLWMTMRVGGTGTPSWDTEMSPRLKLTAVPYAFRAGELAKLTGADTSTLTFDTQTGARDIKLPDEDGVLCIRTSASCGFATGTAASYIQNTTTLQTNANMAIQSAADGSVTALFKGRATQSADIIRVVNSSDGLIFNIDSFGNARFTGDANLDGYLGVGSSSAQTSGVALRMYTTDPSHVGIEVHGDPSQTADLLVLDGPDTRALNYTASGTLALTAGSGQSADVLGLTDSSGATLATFGPTGDVLFRTATNSATALRVQKSTGSDTVLTADTSNNRVVIGNATAASSADTTLLVLDSAATSNAPTGANGGMFYDTTLNKFRCYQNSGWVDCVNTAVGGVSTVGTFSGSSQINGATISGSTITFGPADATNPGMVSTGTQTFAGTKTFASDVVIQGANALTLGTTGTNTGAIVFRGATAASGSITLVGATNPSTNNYTLTIPTLTANASICTDNGICNGYAASAASGFYLQQVPTSNTANAVGANVVSPTAAGIVGLTVNGTTDAAGATALVVAQSIASDAMHIDVTNAAGAAGSALSIAKTGAGTLNNGLLFSGTIGTDINRTTGVLTLQGAGGVTITAAGTTTLAADTAGAGTVNVGNGFATSINIGGASSATTTIAGGNVGHTVNIAAAGTSTVQSVTIGSVGSTSTTTLQAGSGNIMLNTSIAQFTEVAGTRTLGVQTRTTNAAGTGLTIQGGAGGSGASANAGGNLKLQGGAGGGTNGNGGSAYVYGGAKNGTGTDGNVILAHDGTNPIGNVGIGTAAPTRPLHIVVNNSTVTAPTVLIEQAGSGDSSIEFMSSAGSFYAGIDTSDSGKFKISSPSAASSTPAQMGYTTIGGTLDGGDVNYQNATRFPMGGTAGTMTSMTVYINGGSASNHYQVALYADNGSGGRPGTRLATSSSANIVANAWNTVPITASLSASTNYWLAFNTDDATANMMYDTGASNTSCYTPSPFGTWASPFGDTCTLGTQLFSIYATYSLAGTIDSLSGSIFSLSSTGQMLFRNSTNSTTAFQVQNAAASNTVLAADTLNSRVGINLAASEAPLYDLSFGGGAARTIGINQNPATGAGAALTVRAGAANTTGVGGLLTLQGGAGAGSGQAGGGVTITGGAPGTGNIAGSAVTVNSGAGSGTQAGGLITIQAGQGGATGAGGGVTVRAGSGGATSGAGGLVTIQGGNATAGASGGGGVSILGGTATTTGAASNITITAGNGVSGQNTAGGAVNITSGTGGGTQAGGVIALQAGTGGGTNGIGGGITLTGGTGGATNAAGGAVTVSGGTASGTGTGGLLTLQGGAASATAGSATGGATLRSQNGANGLNGTAGGAAGAVTLQGGNGGAGTGTNGTGATGSNLVLRAGNGGNATGTGTNGNGGAITLTAGTAGSGGSTGTPTGGAVTLQGGAAAAVAGSAGGAVVINAAAGSATGTGGAGGAITLTAGNSGGSGNFAGGGISLTSGNGSGNLAGGTLGLQAGNGGATGNGGAVSVFAGNAGGATLAGGAITVRGGVGNTSGLGGGLTLQGGTGGNAAAGGAVTVQGGTGGGGTANGANVNLVGGTTSGSGVKGLVVIDTATFSTATQQSSGTSVNITQANIDSFGAVILNATATSVNFTLSDPTLGASAAGRIIYVMAANGTNDFTLRANVGEGTGIEQNISMRQNTTATMIWTGSNWTAAGASSSTTLQSAYDSTLTSAGGAELVLNAAGGNADGLTIRNNGTTPIVGGLLEVQTSIGSNLLTVNNNATEYATNGGAETAGASSSTFPSTTWDTTTGGTVDRWTTAGDNIATGQASVRVQTTTTNHGARNRISASLTSGLTYTVSFAVRGAANFSTLQVLYSPDGTTTGTTQCAAAQVVTSGIWTRITCTFVAAGTITSSNSILIRQTDATARTFYIDNLSINVNASATFAADGSVDVALGSNWTAFGTLDSLTRDTSVIYDTSGSVNVNTPNAADRGVRNNLAITPAVSTQYLVTFYARSSNTFSDIRVRYTRDGGTNFVTCVDYSTQSVSTSSFTEISCLFTTDGTTPSNPDLVIDQPTGSDRIFYVDALSITLNTNNSNNVQVGGANKGGPTTLFTLDRSNGAPIAANNEAYLGSMYYDTTSGRIQCYEADGWGACGAAPDNIVNLNPEYAGAVLNGTGIGTMTADFCSDDTALQINVSLCETGQAKNFYKWTSPQATVQTYSIYVTYQLPATFNGFSSDDTVQLVARTDSTTNAAVTYEMYKSTGSAVTLCGSGETTVVTSADTWQSVGINGNEATGCSFSSSSAGNFVIFKINMKANSNANAYVSTLSFTTTGR